MEREVLLGREFSRKLIHSGSALAIFFLAYFLSRNIILVICAFFVLLAILVRSVGWFSDLRNVGRISFGEIYLPLGIGLAAWFFLPSARLAFQFGVLVVGISDAVAGMVGRTLGSRRTKLIGEKSLEGSTSFFVSTLIIFLLLARPGTPIIFIAGVLSAFILTLIELTLGAGLDNLFLPILSALLIKFSTGI